MPIAKHGEVVKQCPMCAHPFTLGDVMAHPEVKPIGMAFLGEVNQYFFNHVCAGCGSTFTIPVEAFLALIQEPVPAQALVGTSRCEHHCRRVTDLQRCAQPCRYAPFRRFLLERLLPRPAAAAPAP